MIKYKNDSLFKKSLKKKFHVYIRNCLFYRWADHTRDNIIPLTNHY